MNPEQWLSLKWNGGSTMSDRWLNQSKIIHLLISVLETMDLSLYLLSFYFNSFSSFKNSSVEIYKFSNIGIKYLDGLRVCLLPNLKNHNAFSLTISTKQIGTINFIGKHHLIHRHQICKIFSKSLWKMD